MHNGSAITPKTLLEVAENRYPGKWFKARVPQLLEALGRDATPVEARAAWEVAFWEYKLGLMQHASVTEGDGKSGDLLRRINTASNTLRQWYSFLEVRPMDQAVHRDLSALVTSRLSDQSVTDSEEVEPEADQIAQGQQQAADGPQKPSEGTSSTEALQGAPVATEAASEDGEQ